ncbi:hypothetical protein NMY22_g3294 [Coprinellus aureogranulatus]|nr:hypothetical protein NMY22_g3294 [Coprinellus aureogranulatus]
MSCMQSEEEKEQAIQIAQLLIDIQESRRQRRLKAPHLPFPSINDLASDVVRIRRQHCQQPTTTTTGSNSRSEGGVGLKDPKKGPQPSTPSAQGGSAHCSRALQLIADTERWQKYLIEMYRDESSSDDDVLPPSPPRKRQHKRRRIVAANVLA